MTNKSDKGTVFSLSLKKMPGSHHQVMILFLFVLTSVALGFVPMPSSIVMAQTTQITISGLLAGAYGNSPLTGPGYVTVDGMPISVPKTYTWTLGSAHTLSATAPVALGTGSRARWFTWTGGQGASHSCLPCQTETYTVTSGDLGGTSNVIAFYYNQFLFTVNVNPSGAGTTSPVSGAIWVDAGYAYNLSATPNGSNIFNSWSTTYNGVPDIARCTGTANPIYCMVDLPNLVVTANFSIPPPSYTITVNTSPAGLDYPYGGGSYLAGQTANIGVNAVDGYDFVRWNRDGASYTTNMSFSYTVDASHTFTAVFQPATVIYTIRILDHDTLVPISGTITITGKGTFSNDQTVSLNVGTAYSISTSAPSGSTFVTWDGTNAYFTIPCYTCSNTTFTINVDADGYLVARWYPPSYTITVNTSPAGLDAPYGGGSYYAGQTANIGVSNVSCYNFVRWNRDGVSYTTDMSFGYTVDRNRTFTAVFSAIPSYSLTVSAGSGGTVSGTPSGSYCTGTSISVIANPNAGYQFSSWSGSGYSCGANNPCSFSMPANAVTLTANFIVQPNQPNLAITSFTVPDGTAGTAGTASVTVINNGAASTGIGFEVGFHDGSPAIASINCTNEETGVVTAILAAGSSVNVSVPFTYPAAGTYTARVMADSDCQIAESNESDNASSDAYTSTLPPQPQPPGNVSGWGWSENVGWISMNCRNTNTCAALSYGVNVASTTGLMSGYAWSRGTNPNTGGVGWMSFNTSDLAGCPIGPCEAKVNLVTGQVSGWAKVMGAAGGWLGWIRLRGPLYGVSINTATREFEGWAWSDMVLGWMSFNCLDRGVCAGSNYKVVLDEDLFNKPPVARIACSPASCAAYTGDLLTLLNQSTDPNGQSDIVRSEWDVYNRGSDPDSTCVPPDNPLCNYTVPTLMLGRGNYTAELLVQDRAGASDTETADFTIKRDAVADFQCSLTNLDTDWHNCANFTVATGTAVYFKDLSVGSEINPTTDAVIIRRSWTFPDGQPGQNIDNDTNPSTQFLVRGSKNVVLTITDSQGRTDSQTYGLNVVAEIPPPEWREIPPFIWFRNFFAAVAGYFKDWF